VSQERDSLSEVDRLRFQEEVGVEDEKINLALAALLVAREEYAQLPLDGFLLRLDLLAEETRDRLNGETAPLIVLQELLNTLYHRHDFRGNREAYYDPRNSFLNDVLDRGLGIPLTLAIVLLEVGWRLDLPLEGVNFPGHFLVRFRGDVVDLLLDPYDGGALRFQDQAQELLDRIYGGMIRVHDSFLKKARKREMLVRLLTNLKSLYLNAGDHKRALAAVERILLIRPSVPVETRDRGVILAQLGRNAEALEELETYLKEVPEAGDSEKIQGIVESLRDGSSQAG
jgi:regulator of sirC expression with transglutaminase-like and TPR domain